MQLFQTWCEKSYTGGGEILCGWERDRDREGERDDKWVLGEENESNI